MIVSTTRCGAVAPARWRVPFVCPDLPEPEGVAASMGAAIAAGALTKGPHLAAFESAVAGLAGVRKAVGMSSCTVGLALLMRALAHLESSRDPARAGRREVILPSFMFLAGPAAVVWAGLEPVFVDVDPATWTLLPEAAEAAITPHTFAILGCHTFGVPADVEGLDAVACRAGVPLVFDAAHGFGSMRSGRQVGREGRAQVFSLSPTKLVVAGEGGMVTTDDEPLAALLDEAREYGNDGRYGCTLAGLNGRMPESCAILGAASLARLPQVAARRRAAAEAYREGLEGLPGFTIQRVPQGAESSWKDVSVLVDPSRFGIDRDAVRSRLAAEGIDTRGYYSPACHAMEAFRRFHEGRRPLATTDRLASSCLSLPMGRHVTPEVALEIAGSIARMHVHS